MALTGLRRWHWMLIGALLGLILAVFRQWSAEDGWQPNGDSYHPIALENVLLRARMSKAAPQNSLPEIRNVRVYPRSDGVFDLTFSVPARHRAEPIKEQPGSFRIPYDDHWSHLTTDYVPNKVFGLPASPKPTIIEVLKVVRDDAPDFNFKVVWWTQRPAIWALWGGIPFAIVGIIWPSIIQLLIRLGYAQAPEPKPERVIDLRRTPSRPAKPIAARPSVTKADMDQLTAMERAIEENLRRDAEANPAAPAAPPVAAGKPGTAPKPFVVPTAPVDTPATRPDGSPWGDREFGADAGDYYPTEVHGKKKK